MLTRLRKKLFPAKEPERSWLFRCLILAAMLVPLVAIARVSLLGPHALLAAMGMGLGHWYSYRYLDRPNQLVRAIMFVAIHVALLWLFVGLANGARVPQAQFAIFAQAITSFDLRYRGSLFNTLIHSLANLYVAASLSRTSELALYLVLFAILVLAAFFVAEKEDGLKKATLRPQVAPGPGVHRRRPGLFSQAGMITFGFSFGLVALVAIAVVFVLTPRFASRPIVPPFTINAPLRGGVKSEIINPGVPVVQINGWSSDSSDYYYGFDTDLDLRYRGGLSDEVVMYVRSPSRSYWRSHSYDFYTGVSWSQSDKTLRNIDGRGSVYYELLPPLGAPLSEADSPAGPRRPRHLEELLGNASPPAQQIVQSFTVVRDQPNLIFAAYRPAELFIVTEELSIDSGDGIRLPEPLQAGLTYTVISYRPEFEPALLRQASTDYPGPITRRYLQLPDNISERVKNLARQVTAPYDNNYDRVEALNNHLLTTYPYNFFPPPHPPGAEVADTFLFEDKEGICEQYVTALVVMARTLGIPARLAAGYGAGRYNSLTGYYEVRLSDAHSWTEIYFPEYGWVPFDPTPGWLPQPYPTPVKTWLFSGDGRLPGLDLPIGQFVSSGLTGLAWAGPFIIGVVLLAILVVLGLFLSRRLRFPFRFKTRPGYSKTAAAPTRRQILALYQRGVSLLLRRRYRRRQSWETLGEYARSVGDLPALAELTRAAETAAYQPEPPPGELVIRAKTALARLKQQLQRPAAE